MLESIDPGTLVLCFVGLFVACLLVYWDASNHSEYGWLWFAFCLFIPPVLLVYVGMRLWSNRGAGAKEEFKRKLEREQFKSRQLSEVDRLHFLTLAAEGSGTMYERADEHRGYRHFSDGRAETLIEAGQYGQAFEYLADLYAEAKTDGDGVRVDTYLYYINQLPDGPERLEQWCNANIEHTREGEAPPF